MGARHRGQTVRQAHEGVVGDANQQSLKWIEPVTEELNGAALNSMNAIVIVHCTINFSDCAALVISACAHFETMNGSVNGAALNFLNVNYGTRTGIF